jgi:hypothetical protein
VHQTRIQLFLHNLGDKGNLFCKFTVKETGGERLVAAMRLIRSSMVAGVASDDTSIPRIRWEASPRGPCPPPRLQLRRAATDLLAHGEGFVARVLRLWMKICAKGGAIYRGFQIGS